MEVQQFERKIFVPAQRKYRQSREDEQQYYECSYYDYADMIDNDDLQNKSSRVLITDEQEDRILQAQKRQCFRQSEYIPCEKFQLDLTPEVQGVIEYEVQNVPVQPEFNHAYNFVEDREEFVMLDNGEIDYMETLTFQPEPAAIIRKKNKDYLKNQLINKKISKGR